MTNAAIIVNQQDYLKEHRLAKNGSIEEQCWAKANIKKFHKSVQFSVSRRKVCQEAWLWWPVVLIEIYHVKLKIESEKMKFKNETQ